MPLVTVFVVSPAKMGITASRAAIFPDAANDAADTAAECASPKPVIAVATATPLRPNHAFTADANVTAVTVAASINVNFRSNADPGGEATFDWCFKARRVKMAP